MHNYIVFTIMYKSNSDIVCRILVSHAVVSTHFTNRSNLLLLRYLKERHARDSQLFICSTVMYITQ